MYAKYAKYLKYAKYVFGTSDAYICNSINMPRYAIKNMHEICKYMQKYAVGNVHN